MCVVCLNLTLFFLEVWGRFWTHFTKIYTNIAASKNQFSQKAPREPKIVSCRARDGANNALSGSTIGVVTAEKINIFCGVHFSEILNQQWCIFYFSDLRCIFFFLPHIKWRAVVWLTVVVSGRSAVTHATQGSTLFAPEMKRFCYTRALI